jgi:hypothetical protein
MVSVGEAWLQPVVALKPPISAAMLIAAEHATHTCAPRARPACYCCCMCARADDRQLPQFPSPGGLFGGLVGGLVNQAVKGLASEMQKTAAQTRSVSETAALRIQNSSILQQRLGRVTVGPAMSQSMSSSNINGRVSKNISLLLPVYGPGGRPVAQAQVTQVEAGGRVDSCVIAVSDSVCWGTAWGMERKEAHAWSDRSIWGDRRVLRRGWGGRGSRVPYLGHKAKVQQEDSLCSRQGVPAVAGTHTVLGKLRQGKPLGSRQQHAYSSQLYM